MLKETSTNAKRDINKRQRRHKQMLKETYTNAKGDINKC